MQNPVSLKIKRKLNKLDSELKNLVTDSGIELSKGYLQTVEAGGKRLRPALVFLCSQFKGGDKKNIFNAALAVELIHAASLIHDDIMDGAIIRRGKPTVYSKWGPKVALRIGDYLFAKAFLLLCKTDDFEAISVLADAVRKLSEGEIEQIKSAYKLEQTTSYYFQKINLKTASLFRASAELGAIFGGAQNSKVKALGAFAQNLGMAFQIFDDVLDIEAEEQVLGKSLGTDLRDGTLTLPILFGLKETNDNHDNRLAKIFISKNCSNSDIEDGLKIIVDTQAIDKTRKEAKRFVGKALKELEYIDNTPLKNELSNICEYTIERFN